MRYAVTSTISRASAFSRWHFSLTHDSRAWRPVRLRGKLKLTVATRWEETMKALLRLLALGAAACALLTPAHALRAQLLITGNDEKVSFNENTGKTITHPAGKDTVSIIDIADPAKPKIIVNLPLMNTITGPPVNLAITPDQHLALVANSLDWIKDDEGWKGVPDNKIYVIDLTTSPPVQIATVEAGKQPSGMAINRAGTLALVANRAEDSVMRQGWGRIVNVTTSLGTMINLGFPTYGPSKAALEALSAIMAKDLDGTGVTVNVLVPGGITNTPMVSESGFDRAQMIQPEVMAPPLLWLVSDAAGKVTGRRFLGVHWDPELPPE